MSKITQIQTELRRIDPAKFQQLCDSYLHRQGYKNINSIGLVIGAEKVKKGTPDSLVALPNGNYIFAEYTTTSEKTLVQKFKSDLAKCFNETKTGVPLARIEEIILCHTSVLSSREDYELTEYCKQHGCKLTMYGISPMSQDLYQKFPGLAKDFLGVEVDTGQIIEPSDFVAIYNKSALTTPLDTTFQFREEEVSNILTHLAEQNLVIIVGRAGVGKSRLALECCARFVEQRPEYTTWCILNRGVHLYDDLKVYFSPAGHYLIFVDDANRVSGFEFILQLLHEQRNDRTVKVVATVRDYALEKIRDSVRPYGGGWEIEVQPFANEQIGKMVSTLFNIQNHLYLERITAISSGNPRLAIMASQIAVRENKLNSIRDVSALYDEYYRSIRTDLTSLNDHNVLKVVGIVAFFRHVDRSNDALMQAISVAFDISPDTFWEAVHHLHHLELVDLYENEVVRVSDQVLSTYLFYMVFFKEHLISIETLLQHFFPRFTFRFIDALNPVINAFDNTIVLDVLRPQVTRFREELKSTHNIEDVLELVRMFWYLDETENLLYIRECIASIEPQPVAWSETLFSPDAQAAELPIPRTLGVFRYASLPSVHIALELLFNYVEKRRAELPSILHHLLLDFGFTHRSYFTDYVVEHELVKVLKSRLDQNDTDHYPYIFFVVADRFLRVQFHTTESHGRNTVTVYNFQLVSTPELTALRADILRCLFALYKVPTLRSEVVAVLHSYTLSNGETGEGNVIREDATYMLPFITEQLDTSEYTHCLFVHDYLDLLRQRNIEFDNAIRNHFFHENMAVKEVLFNNIRDQVEMGFDEYHVYKQQQIIAYFAAFDLSQYQHFFSQCEAIAQARYPQRRTGEISQGIVEILMNLSTTNAALFEEVVAYILHQGNSLALEPWMLVAQLVTICGADRAYVILSKPQYQRKRSWLFHFFFALPSELITNERLTQLISLYEEAEPQDISSSFDYLVTNGAGSQMTN